MVRVLPVPGGPCTVGGWRCAGQGGRHGRCNAACELGVARQRHHAHGTHMARKRLNTRCLLVEMQSQDAHVVMGSTHSNSHSSS